MRYLPLSLTFGALCACAATPPTPSPGNDHAATVQRFVAAFNAHDVDAMTAMVSADVQWLSVDGAATRIETGSREALAASMTRYFVSCPSCRSELGAIAPTPSRVSTIEIAHWDTPSGAKSQRSIAVYEFDGALIRRVYYFPAER